MNLLFILLFIFSPQPQSSASAASDPALSARIETLFRTVLTTDKESKEALAVSETKNIFTEHGLSTASEVGDLSAYELVVLLASEKLSLEFRTQVLAKVKEAVARRDIPSDAATFYEARLRLDKVKEEAKTHRPTNPDLRDELERMFKADQAVRQQQGFDPQKMAEIDRQNAAPLQAILDKYGVPTYAMVGPQVSGEFVDMIQHQPARFRQQVLPRLKAYVGAGQAEPQSYALVYDRSQGDLGKKQLYGENFVCGAGQKLHAAPIEDESHVNQRRAKLGLIRIELYARLVQETMPQVCRPSDRTE